VFPFDLALALLRLRLVHARQAGRIEVGHARANFGNLDAKPSRQTVVVTGPVNDDKIAPVATRQHVVARRFQCGLEAVPVVGAVPVPPDIRLDCLRVDLVGAEDLMLLRAAVGPLGVATGNKDALPAFEVEADFKLARRAFVNGGGERVRDRPHVLDVDARPHDMPVRAAVLLVLDHKARLAGEAEILFQPVNRLAPLCRRQRLVGARIDVGLIEIVLALGVGGEFLHVAEGVGDGFSEEARKLDNRDALVLLGVLQMLSPPSPGAVAAAVDDDRHGYAPSSARIASHSSLCAACAAFIAACISSSSGKSRKS
jgi:hypothetical protein